MPPGQKGKVRSTRYPLSLCIECPTVQLLVFVKSVLCQPPTPSQLTVGSLPCSFHLKTREHYDRGGNIFFLKFHNFGASGPHKLIWRKS